MKTMIPSKTSSSRSQPLELVPFYLKIKKILVPVDFSEASMKAFKLALPFAEQFGASITLLHVVEERHLMPPFDLEYVRLLEVAREKSKNKLKELAPKLAGASSIKIRSVVEDGKPYEVINRVAGEMHADLIIIATQGLTGLKHAVLGSTTERVVRHATCPVLTVR